MSKAVKFGHQSNQNIFGVLRLMSRVSWQTDRVNFIYEQYSSHVSCAATLLSKPFRALAKAAFYGFSCANSNEGAVCLLSRFLLVQEQLLSLHK